jgi:glycosyltransferase involved in cell wall biosynthesis
MKLGIVIPSHEHQDSLDKVIDAIPAGLRPGVFVVDDGSNTPLRASAVNLISHGQNRGYGAAQKTGYRAALQWGADAVAMIHGDHQYSPSTILAAAKLLEGHDLLLGSRFLERNGRGIPWWRWSGNRLLTTIANQRFGTHFTDLHTGARLYRSEILAQTPLDDFSDDFVFDQQLLLYWIQRGARFLEFPIRPKYGEDVSSISLGASLRYGFGCLRLAIEKPMPLPK